MKKLDHANLKGTFTALVTPFNADGSEVDYRSLENLIEYQISSGVDGVVVCGSTGEAATLSDEEYKSVVRHCNKIINRRVYCIAGIGSSSTARAAEMGRFLSESGVDGALLVTPPYNKPTQEGIVLHFQAVKAALNIPLIAYNIPGRTGMNIQAKTLAQMWKQNIIIGVKDSTGSLDQIVDLISYAGRDLAILSGEDSLVHSIMATGGSGVISASANLLPKEFSVLTGAALNGHWEESLKTQILILPVLRALFLETNPIPVKGGLHLQGLIQHRTVRLPLTEISSNTLDVLGSALKLLGK